MKKHYYVAGPDIFLCIPEYFVGATHREAKWLMGVLKAGGLLREKKFKVCCVHNGLF